MEGYNWGHVNTSYHLVCFYIHSLW